MKKIKFYIIGSLILLMFSCKGQDKNEVINNSNNQKVNDLNGITLLEVEKTDSLYTVYNRCDGGNGVLRISEKEFYYYHPQEGAYYNIQNVEKINSNKYKITSDGYYFFKNDKLIPENSVWSLTKKNNLLWEFGKESNKNKVLLSDSLNIKIGKIAYKVQPLSECSENNEEEVKGDNLVGKWGTNCENPIGIVIKENELIMCVEPNVYYIHLTKINKKKEDKILKYKLKGFEGIGSKDVNAQSYFNDNEIAIVKILEDNKIEFTWLGFYNKVNKERQNTESLISNENPTILKKCY
ncbi:hypothetical protein [Flavobacterium hydatis]|uniref:Lipoprotein n=1 Tax=Flavobacterium hydatis TaxID=991 RepID=A0A085ZBG8_FLAHY|nr:hypothetical protein [Flavobacterium hydatis]KFF01782.1 hypothetical protein IW20_25650 [Flavobacterium hydatis]OXA84795.1 hypothetical protein B0A62_25025 [Flavobacterium hydatis]